MCCHLGVGSGVVLEQAEGVGQEQVVQFILDPAEHTPIEPLAVKGQIDIGAGPCCALGARTEKDGTFDLGVMRLHLSDPLLRVTAQSVPVHDSVPRSWVNRFENCENCAQYRLRMASVISFAVSSL